MNWAQRIYTTHREDIKHNPVCGKPYCTLDNCSRCTNELVRRAHEAIGDEEDLSEEPTQSAK